MKATLFDGNIFWGSLIIIFGISVLLKAYGITFPVMRLFFGALLIYIGVYILTHRDALSYSYSFNKTTYTHTKEPNKEKYSVAFAKEK